MNMSSFLYLIHVQLIMQKYVFNEYPAMRCQWALLKYDWIRYSGGLITLEAHCVIQCLDLLLILLLMNTSLVTIM